MFYWLYVLRVDQSKWDSLIYKGSAIIHLLGTPQAQMSEAARLSMCL